MKALTLHRPWDVVWGLPSHVEARVLEQLRSDK
jgi:hypothetical protein